MVDQAPAEIVYTEAADPLFRAERAHIGLGTESALGLAISGGGIRSASFALGLLQALYGFGAFDKFHYLSTVSGGGYIGGALTYFRNAFTEFGADWFPFGYLRRRDDGVVIRPMGARIGAPDDHDGNARARKIVAYLRQHASYMTPSRAFGGPALAAGVLRCAASTFLPYFAVLTGAFGLLVWLGFFAAGPRTASGIYLAAWPTNVAIVIAALILLAFVLSSVFAGIFHTLDRSEKTAESGYLALIWFYRQSGRLLVLATVLLAVATLPWVHEYLNSLWEASGPLPANFTALFAAIGGAAALVGRLRGVLGGETTKPSPLRAIGMALAGLLFIYGILLLAYGVSVDLLGAQGPVFPATVTAAASAAAMPSYCWSGTALAAGLIFAFFININHATQHRIYRDRLMEVFCAEKSAVKSGEWRAARRAQSPEGWLVHMVARPRPYHLINTCLVTTDSNKRKFRGRGGDNFILSPLFCGSDATGWVKTEIGMRNLSLATAIAVSGAALNAHSGPHGTGLLRNKAYSALLSMVGLNLGYWARNPRKFAGGPRSWPWMPNLLKPGLAALTGHDLSEIGGYVQLSDGGHFENLAIYELIRRKVGFLWVSDAGQDLGFSFEDLANAIERIRVDFGVNIRFRQEPYDLTHLIPGSAETETVASKNFAAEYNLAKRGYAIGTIEYPDAPHGVIVYVKSTLTRGLPGDLYGYKKRNADFPHQTTLDQFFDEDQFEAYRELGYRLTAQLFRDIEERRGENAPLPPELDKVARILGF
ncbi:MAG TPA: patatin-like phospholipase family protein [Dongiaceae bacterium]|nr:patatin-like phospholipase family protein [Dongiaceae bacterium]